MNHLAATIVLASALFSGCASTTRSTDNSAREISKAIGVRNALEHEREDIVRRAPGSLYVEFISLRRKMGDDAANSMAKEVSEIARGVSSKFETEKYEERFRAVLVAALSEEELEFAASLLSTPRGKSIFAALFDTFQLTKAEFSNGLSSQTSAAIAIYRMKKLNDSPK